MLRWLKTEWNTVVAALLLVSVAASFSGGCIDDKDSGYETGY